MSHTRPSTSGSKMALPRSRSTGPERLNAWNEQFGNELRQAILEDCADPAVRAVLITGAGRGFSSGADLKEMLEQRLRG